MGELEVFLTDWELISFITLIVKSYQILLKNKSKEKQNQWQRAKEMQLKKKYIYQTALARYKIKIKRNQINRVNSKKVKWVNFLKVQSDRGRKQNPRGICHYLRKSCSKSKCCSLFETFKSWRETMSEEHKHKCRSSRGLQLPRQQQQFGNSLGNSFLRLK